MDPRNQIPLVKWSRPIQNTHEEVLKWKIGTQAHEIYISPLTTLNLTELMEHCQDIRNKVFTEVPQENQRALSLFKIFPRSLSGTLKPVWNAAAENRTFPNPTMEEFDVSLRSFIASYITPEDRHELLRQLRNARKPHDITVQDFYYRLREINDYIIWMPGDELPLNENEIKQTFFDAMPPGWRNRYIDAGKSVIHESVQDIMCYFRYQEVRAQAAEHTNNSRQNSFKKSRYSSRRYSPYPQYAVRHKKGYK